MRTKQPANEKVGAGGTAIFPNAASCLRLVSALLAECDEDWMTSKIYLNLKD